MPISFLKKEFPYSHWEIIDYESGDRIRIVPERGGLITEWLCNGKEILYFDYERFTQQGKSVRGGIPILFPICGGLRKDFLPLEKGDFNMDQHGFARDAIWQLKPIEGESAFILSFSDNEITRLNYPFSFLIEMEVRLEKKGIEFKITIENLSHENMPFSFGLHPYFNVMDLEKTKIKGLMPTCIDQSTMIEEATDQQLDCLSDGIDFISGPSKLVSLIDTLDGTCLILKHQKPMDLTVVWTDPPRSMVCLEPWTSPRESIISGERLLSLQPGAIQKLNCSFKLIELQD